MNLCLYYRPPPRLPPRQRAPMESRSVSRNRGAIRRENVHLNTKPPAPVHHSPRSSNPTPRETTTTSSTPTVSLRSDKHQPLATPNNYVETPVGRSLLSRDPERSSESDVIVSQPLQPQKNNNHSSHEQGDSCYCKTCGGCKCDSCKSGRELPRKWVGEQEVSLKCCLDCCTCMPCVKMVFDCMNLTDRENDGTVSDRPCACCDVNRCCERWSIMSIMSLCCPCICFYPLTRCVLKSAKCCYNTATVNACRCRPENEPSKRILIEHEDFSSS